MREEDNTIEEDERTFSFVFVLTTSIGSDKEATRARAEVKVEDGDERKGLIRIAELETT